MSDNESQSNQKELIDRIIREMDDVKHTLRELKIYAESGEEKTPARMVEVLKERCLLLAESIKQYKIKKAFSDSEQNVLEALNDAVIYDPKAFEYKEKDEFELYCEFGCTREEYDQMMIIQQAIARGDGKVDFAAAYDEFVEILKDKQIDPNDDWRKLIPAATGLIGIAGDIVGAVVTGNTITLYASCANGIIAIAGAYKTVRKKLRKLFGRK